MVSEYRWRDLIPPDRSRFSADPFGYGAFGWHRLNLVMRNAGLPVEMKSEPSSTDLKSPVLWMLHAHALIQAALNTYNNQPDLSQIPNEMRGICDSQYCAVVLMLVGYSLEVALKAMLIMKYGIDGYAKQERYYLHHDLEKLADIVPEITEKDRAILRNLKHYVVWAGKYPDPGKGTVKPAVAIFEEAEKYKITLSDLFGLAGRVIQHANTVVGNLSDK